MNDRRFDPSGAQPACQPEAIAAGFEGYDNAMYGLARFDGFIAPAMQQLEQCVRVGDQLLQGVSLNARNQSTYQPSRRTELDDSNYSPMLFQGDEGPAEVIFWLRHWGPLH